MLEKMGKIMTVEGGGGGYDGGGVQNKSMVVEQVVY